MVTRQAPVTLELRNSPGIYQVVCVCFCVPRNGCPAFFSPVPSLFLRHFFFFFTCEYVVRRWLAFLCFACAALWVLILRLALHAQVTLCAVLAECISVS